MQCCSLPRSTPAIRVRLGLHLQFISRRPLSTVSSVSSLKFKKLRPPKSLFGFFRTTSAAPNAPQGLVRVLNTGAKSLATAFLLTFLINHIHSPPSLAVSRIIPSDPMTPRDPETGTIVDYAKILSEQKALGLCREIKDLEVDSGWKIRVLTRTGPSPSPSERPLRDQWQPDDRTVIVVEDITSPNILNFGVGLQVSSRLPRQFFIELQSRYGNQFFVSDEGYQEALLQSIAAIRQCIVREEGCQNVPGLTDDLYYLTLATSVAGGAVLGFGARLGGKGGSLQWVFLLAPLWFILFVSFGILPVTGRTSDWEPLVKNSLAFLVCAVAFYLSPIFGEPPFSSTDR